MLLIQGEDDQYGTAAQLQAAVDLAHGPVETLLLPGVRHAPHLEAPEQVLGAVAEFARRVFEVHEPARGK